jgi:hypothetical protein
MFLLLTGCRVDDFSQPIGSHADTGPMHMSKMLDRNGVARDFS